MVLESMAFPEVLSELFAFKIEERWGGDWWSVYDTTKEFTRQGVIQNEECWQVVDNSSFETVPTYPSYFIVPAQMTLEEIVNGFLIILKNVIF